MADLTVKLTGPYFQCAECRHAGPPASIAAVTLAEPVGSGRFHLIPHKAGCSAPNPFNGPSATVRLDG